MSYEMFFFISLFSNVFVCYIFYSIGEMRGYKEGCSDLKDEILKKFTLKER